MTADQIHGKAMSVAKDLKSKNVELFEILLVVEAKKIYQTFDIISLQTYCVELLQLSPATAKDFVQVLGKAIEIPELRDAVLSKKVSISKARKICPVINVTNAKEWIALARECTCRVIEKTVAMTKPRAEIYDTMRYVSGDTLEFKMAVSEEWEAALRETKDLLSQKHARAVSSEEALLILMKAYCRKESPVAKAERAEARAAAKSNSSTGPDSKRVETDEQSRPRTRYRPARIEHAVNFRDRGQCVHIFKSGNRCPERRWLQKHHIKSFAEGGDHSPKNLETLCFAHHKIRHERESLAKYESSRDDEEHAAVRE